MSYVVTFCAVELQPTTIGSVSGWRGTVTRSSFLNVSLGSTDTLISISVSPSGDGDEAHAEIYVESYDENGATLVAYPRDKRSEEPSADVVNVLVCATWVAP